MRFQVIKDTLSSFSEDKCFTSASSLAYCTLFSLPPLLVLLTGITGLAVDPQHVQQSLQSEFQNLMGQDAAEQLISMLHSAQNTGTGIAAIVIGFITLMIGATGVMVQLQDALNSTWEVEPDRGKGGVWNFLRKRILSFGMILAIAFVMIVSLVVTTALAVIGRYFDHLLPAGLSEAAVFLVDFALSFVMIALLFASIYKVLPDAKLKWRQVIRGAVGTAVLFTIGKEALGFYLGHSSTFTVYGSAGSLVLVMVWIDYSAVIFLLGAEYTKCWSKAHGQRIEPAEGAVHFEQRKEVVDAAPART